MSLEILLLLAFFILAPLIERLVRSARQRNEGTAVRPEERPASAARTAMPEPQPPADGQPRHAAAVPPLPASARQGVSAAVATPLRGLARDAAHRGTSPPTVRGQGRSTAAGLRNPLALRRAIVLMTILGPCRAGETREIPAGAEARRSNA